MSHTEPERGGRYCRECGAEEGHDASCSQVGAQWDEHGRIEANLALQVQELTHKLTAEKLRIWREAPNHIDVQEAVIKKLDLVAAEQLATERERKIEEVWKLYKGVDPETGKAWLTPRMERDARVLELQWKLEEARKLLFAVQPFCEAWACFDLADDIETFLDGKPKVQRGHKKQARRPDSPKPERGKKNEGTGLQAMDPGPEGGGVQADDG
jgi:hypothetical protein